VGAEVAVLWRSGGVGWEAGYSGVRRSCRGCPGE
jgi:hypothetical protein